MKFANPLDCLLQLPLLIFLLVRLRIPDLSGMFVHLPWLNRKLSYIHGTSFSFLLSFTVSGPSCIAFEEIIQYNPSNLLDFPRNPQARWSYIPIISFRPELWLFGSESHPLIYFVSGLGAFSFPNEPLDFFDNWAQHEFLHSNFKKGIHLSCNVYLCQGRRMDLSRHSQRFGSSDCIQSRSNYFGSCRTTVLGDSLSNMGM
jgi:hypothetical protein